jgi:hypothetical protein
LPQLYGVPRFPGPWAGVVANDAATAAGDLHQEIVSCGPPGPGRRYAIRRYLVAGFPGFY